GHTCLGRRLDLVEGVLGGLAELPAATTQPAGGTLAGLGTQLLGLRREDAEPAVDVVVDVLQPLADRGALADAEPRAQVLGPDLGHTCLGRRLDLVEGVLGGLAELPAATTQPAGGTLAGLGTQLLGLRREDAEPAVDVVVDVLQPLADRGALADAEPRAQVLG